MTEAPKLKPCPADCNTDFITMQQVGTRHMMKCDCGWTAPIRANKERAIAAWNDRTDSTAMADKVQALVNAAEALNAACDAMWNDHEHLEENTGRFGQPYRLKERHMRAISEAQQKLPAALAAMKDG